MGREGGIGWWRAHQDKGAASTALETNLLPQIVNLEQRNQVEAQSYRE